MVGKVNAAVRDVAQEWGRNIDWHEYRQGREKAKLENKPIMVIMQTPTCPHCLSLKEKVAQSKAIEELSKHFVMIVLNEWEGKGDKDLGPDGRYVPRIVFCSPTGGTLKHIVNMPNSKNKYAYANLDALVRNMKTVSMAYPTNKEL